MKKANQIPVSVAVVNSLIPQKSMLNAPIADLLDQEFEFSNVLTSLKDSVAEDALNEDSDTDAAQRVRVRFTNTKTRAGLVIPMRSLLATDSVALAKNAKYKDDMKRSKVLDAFVEAGEKATLELVQKFRIVDVKPRTHAVTKKVMYPQYMYEAFNDRVAQIRKDDKTASIDAIYEDFNFIQSLYEKDPEDRYLNQTPPAECLKTIVISMV